MEMILVEEVGLVACVLTLAMYTSTIDQIKNVLKTKKSMGVSPLLYIMMVLNCLFWIFYGFLKVDYYILLPNIVGCTLASTTLIILYTYTQKK